MPKDLTETPPPEEAERQRRTEIRSLVRAAGLPSETADDLIDSGADLTAAKAAVYDAQLARGRAAPIIRTHAPANDDPAVIVRRQSDAIAFRMAGGQLPDDAKPFVETSLLDMARAAVERIGVSTRGMNRDEILQRSAHSTSDFPLVVSNAMAKVALDSYRAAESPLKQLCRQGTLNDFNESKAIRLANSAGSISFPRRANSPRPAAAKRASRSAWRPTAGASTCPGMSSSMMT